MDRKLGRVGPLVAVQTSALALCLVTVLWAPLLLVGTEGSLLASSRVERCVQDGATDVPTITCDRRMIVTLTVDSGQNNTEQLELVLDSTQDENGVVRTLEHPVQIQWAKTIPRLLYPITYVGRTNNKPYETITYKDDILFLFDECNDSPSSSSPTCGWFYNADGTVVKDSQGFCCSCDLSEVLWLSNEQTRAGLTCSLFAFGVDGSSAHCLRFDKLWYDVFSIGAAQVSFEVVLSVRKYQTMTDVYGNTTGGYVTEALRLSPSQTTGTSAGGDIFAKLQGDFAPWSDNPVLSEKYLFVPSSPSTHPRVVAGTDYWMLLDRSSADFSGLTCNKIGVSFSAFRYQGGACGNWPQACLGNQLDDYHKEDLARWEQGQLGRYFVRFWGDFVNNQAVVQTNDQRYLSFALDQIRATVTTLTLNADDIIYTINRSPGRIVAANITGFEGLATQGELDVVVMNNGTIQADYTITVTECGDRIQAVQAKMRSISAYQSANLTFALYSLTNLGFNTGCNVSLYDSLGVIVDSVWVNVTVFATNVTCLGSQCSGGGGGKPANGGYSYAITSCSACNSIFDIACYVDNSCIDKIIVFVVIVVSLLCCCSCCCVCLKSKRGRSAFMGCVKGVCCLACLPVKASTSAADQTRAGRKRRKAKKLKKKKKKMDKKLEKVQKKMAKKENDLKKAKYRKKLDKMTRRRTTLTEALHARAYELDLELSDSSGSGSSGSGSDGDRRPRPAAANRGHSAARRRDAGRAQGRRRSRSAHQDVRTHAYDRRPRSMSVDRATSSTRRDDKRTKAKAQNAKGKGKGKRHEKTWNWGEMMRNGLRSLHSRNDSVRMKDSELIRMAKRSATAYFNIESSSSSASGLLSPGPRFSVRGRLILLEEGVDVWLNFSLERQHQFQYRYMDYDDEEDDDYEEGYSYLELERPVEMPRAYHQTLITLANARRFITAEPVFPCINE